MSTRCRIGLLNPDGTVTSIYCHHDGYVSYVGQLLFSHYDIDKLYQLLDLGDLSSLGPEPVSSEEDWVCSATEHCVAYKDRGENCPARKHESEEDYYEFCKDCGDIEYAYLFKDDGWHFRKWGDFAADNLVEEHLDE